MEIKNALIYHLCFARLFGQTNAHHYFMTFTEKNICISSFFLAEFFCTSLWSFHCNFFVHHCGHFTVMILASKKCPKYLKKVYCL